MYCTRLAVQDHWGSSLLDVDHLCVLRACGWKGLLTLFLLVFFHTLYLSTLVLAGIHFHLFEYDAWISMRLFQNCLYHLLPPHRDLAMTSRLRKLTVYPRPILRTKRYYCSIVSYALLIFSSNQAWAHFVFCVCMCALDDIMYCYLSLCILYFVV